MHLSVVVFASFCCCIRIFLLLYSHLSVVVFAHSMTFYVCQSTHTYQDMCKLHHTQ